MDTLSTRKCLTSIFLIYFAHFNTVASDTVENKSVINQIKCEALSILHKSSYAAECNEMQLPTKFIDRDVDLALCVVIFDFVNRTCDTIDKNINVGKLSLPQTSKDLDNNIKKLEPKSDDYVSFTENFCKKMVSVLKNWSGVDTQNSSLSILYIKYVSEKLLNQHECGYTCRKAGDVNPLCMILSWLNIVVENPTLASDIIVQSTPNPNISKDHGKNKMSSIDDLNKYKLQKIEENTSPMNKISKNQTIKPSIPINPPIINGGNNNFSVHNEYVLNKHPKESADIDVIDETKKSTAASTHNKVVIVTSKTIDILMDKPKPILQSEANIDKTIALNENNKNKIIENKDEESEEHANDFKEVTDPEFLSSINEGNQIGYYEEGKKSFPHSSLVEDDDESHFFTYFSILTLIFIGVYIGYHNKQKILAIVLEGRRSRRGRNSRRRPSTASYHKLDCNLEEAVTSQCNANVTHVIY